MSRACCTRSAAPGTSCVLDRLPIRWRLALTSAGLTLIILSGFAVVVGQLTVSRIRSDYNNELAAAVDRLRDELRLEVDSRTAQLVKVRPDLNLFSASNNATIRVLDVIREASASMWLSPVCGSASHIFTVTPRLAKATHGWTLASCPLSATTTSSPGPRTSA